jgi:hypothetical protein
MTGNRAVIINGWQGFMMERTKWASVAVLAVLRAVAAVTPAVTYCCSNRNRAQLVAAIRMAGTAFVLMQSVNIRLATNSMTGGADWVIKSPVVMVSFGISCRYWIWMRISSMALLAILRIIIRGGAIVDHIRNNARIKFATGIAMARITFNQWIIGGSCQVHCINLLLGIYPVTF